MHVLYYALSVLFLVCCSAQSSGTFGYSEDGTLGGFSNGLRYILRLSNYYGTGGRPAGSYCANYAYNSGALPSYNSSTPGTGNRDFRVCFYMRDSRYIYTTACSEGTGYVEHFYWAGENFTLPYSVGTPGTSVGTGNWSYHTTASDRRFISFDAAATRYDYYADSGISGGRYRNFNGGYVNNQYTVLTLTPDRTRIERYSVFTEYCVYEYTPVWVWSASAPTSGTSDYSRYGQKTYSAFPYRTMMFSTQVISGTTNRFSCYSGRGSGTGYGGTFQANADRSVCVNNCPGSTYNLVGWAAMPRYICVRSDEWNTYTVTDCLDGILAVYRHTNGGYYDYNTALSNSPYRPYSFLQNSARSLKVVTWSNYTYGSGNVSDMNSAYRLEGSNAQASCAGTWSAPLVPVTPKVSPPFYPTPGVYRFYSNIPTPGLNNWHFANLGYNNTSGSGIGDCTNVYPQRNYGSGCGGTDTWWNFCYNNLYNPKTGVRPAFTRMPMTVCLQTVGANKWAFTDCDDEQTYATFGWNGVDWSGWEDGRPITVSFGANTNTVVDDITTRPVTGYTFIHASGMCTGTFDVRRFVENRPARIMNGRYERSAPARGYNFAGNYYRYADYYSSVGGSSYNAWAFQRCTDYAPPPAHDDVCIYNMGSRIATFECSTGMPISRYAWTGTQWEQSRPWGIMGGERNFEFIPTHNITEDGTGFSMVLVRGGCFWIYDFTYSPTIAHTGPHDMARGHYSRSSSVTYEGACYADPMYDDIQLHPEGILGIIIRDGESGELLARLNYDQSIWVGRDELRGSFIYAIDSDGNGTMALLGQSDNCGWMINYDVEEDVAPLPKIVTEDNKHDDDEEQTDPPEDGFGVYNGWVREEDLPEDCYDEDNSLLDPVNKFETVCVYPSGPAKLIITQCSDDRDDRFTTIMEVWWDGANEQWYGTDDKYWYTWKIARNEDGDVEDNRFWISATSDSEACSNFTVELWRGDDCYTTGWKAGIITLALLLFGVILIAVFIVTGGSGGSSSSGDYVGM